VDKHAIADGAASFDFTAMFASISTHAFAREPEGEQRWAHAPNCEAGMRDKEK
jgi:hypothetical protein